MVDKFDWARCNKSDGKFDAKKLAAINHEHLKQERLTSFETYVESVVPFLEKRGLDARNRLEIVRKAIPTIRERARTYVEAAEAMDFYLRDELVFDDKAKAKFFVASAKPMLSELADVVAKVEPFTHAALEAEVTKYLESRGLQIKDVAQPARVALTGRSVSPGLYETMEVLGRDVSVKRLRAGAAQIA
jgi:glutamyl-tRNA synthetase